MHRISLYLTPVVVSIALLAVCGTGSATPLTWSAGQLIDGSGGVASASPLVCPSATLCLEDDANNQIVEFDPAAPSVVTRVSIIAPALPSGLSCASATQCTQVDEFGGEATFNPGAPPATLPYDSFHSVTNAQSNFQAPYAVACPSTNECVLVDDMSRVWVFDPASPSSAVTASLDAGRDAGLDAVTCASASQCIATNQLGEWTFNPADPGAFTSATIDGGVGAFACSAATQCTTLGPGGETTFDPQTGAAGAAVALKTSASAGFGGLACPSTVLCVTTEQISRVSNDLISFDPQTGQSLADVAFPATGDIACPELSLCVVDDDAGHAVVFSPDDAAAAASTLVDPGAPLLSLSCPGATQCTAVDSRHELTFDPLSANPTAADSGTIPGLSTLPVFVVCPAPALCSVTRGIHQLSFNPQRFGNPVARSVRPRYSDAGALRCPSVSECVAIEAGEAFVYDPRSGRIVTPQVEFDYTAALTALACPSRAQCTATDAAGKMFTFDPLSGDLLATASIDRRVGILGFSGPRGSDEELDGVACPSTLVCLAVDTLGNVVNFDPRSTRRARPHMVDWFGGLTSVACPSVGLCVLGDSFGRVWSGSAGDSRWALTPLGNASAINAIDCVSNEECIAVDDAGDEFTGRG